LRHADGERCFGGNDWFIIGIEPPGGNSVTYHLPAELYPVAQATGATELAKGRPWDGHTASDVVLRLKEWAAMAEPQGPTVIGPEWQTCVKLPITVHVREQRPDETHSSTREGITPLRPDDLIMRGVQGEEYPIGRELFNQTYRMGAALAQPEPKMVYRYSPVTTAECGGPCEQGPEYCDCGEIKGELEPQPELQGPTDEELDELFIDIDQGGEALNWRPYARAVLARWGRPAIEPVPVGERLPKPEDCDDQGRCWMCGKVDGDWMLISIDNPGVPQLKYAFSHWLPHWALPVPQQTP
jgi:hypothetical protein